MGNITKFTPTQAIQSVKGLHRKKLYQMMQNGQITYEKHNNSRLIDASELIRVFGTDFMPDETPETMQKSSQKQHDTSVKHAEHLVLQNEVRLLQDRLSDKDKMIQDKELLLADIREDRDQWRSQAQRLLITDERTEDKQKTLQTEMPVSASSLDDNENKNKATSGTIWIVVLFASITFTAIVGYRVLSYFFSM